MSRNSVVHGAHRSTSAHYPENTIWAFSRAIKQGAEAVAGKYKVVSGVASPSTAQGVANARALSRLLVLMRF